EGVTVRQVLALIPECFRTMDNLVIKFSPLTENWADHPNILVTDPSEDEDEAKAAAEDSAEDHDHDDAEALEGETNMEKLRRLARAGSEGAVACMIMAAMSREGRSLMTNEETTLLGSVIPQSHMAEAATEEATGSAEASNSTSTPGLSSTAAHAVATAPWRGNKRTAAPPSSANKKLASQLEVLSCYVESLEDKHPYACLGAVGLHTLSSSLNSSQYEGRVLSPEPQPCGLTFPVHLTCGNVLDKTDATFEIEIVRGTKTASPLRMRQVTYSAVVRMNTQPLHIDTAIMAFRLTLGYLVLLTGIAHMVQALASLCILFYLAGNFSQPHLGGSGNVHPPSNRTQALPRQKKPALDQKELETYLRQERVDIAFIQESKWRFESTWETAEFLYIHSCGTGPVDRVGGVLTIVSKRLAKASDLQFQVLHGGRLLHVRVPCGGVHVDLLNYYQYAVVQEDVVYERRQKLFVKLQKCVAGLPRRNSLILAGDFNCPFIPSGNVCGTHVVSPSEDHYRDLQDQQNIAKSLKLTALNTWQRPTHGQVATFTAFSDRSAQIDFIVVRSRQATASSKQAAVLPDFPVAAWREGPKHHPVQAWVTLPPPPWIKARPTTFEPRKIDKEAIIQDLKKDPPPPALNALRQEVTAHLTGVPSGLNHILMKAALRHYPLCRQANRGATQPEDLANQAKDMWQKFRSMRAHRFNMAGVVTAWRQWTEFQQAHALHKARLRMRAINAYKVWQAVRRLELQWIVTAYGDRFGAQAVPRSTGPAVVFKACSRIIAAPVATHFNETWAQEDPTVDQDWADAEVALLPKAHGRSATPLDWRPIGLQDPLGKCVMGLIVAQAREAIVGLVRQYPQCAYLPGRSTHTALRKVFQHCHCVREECSKARRTIHDQHAGAAPVGCAGGLQISVDLSAAFDVVHWDHLKESLDLAGVNLLVQEVILQWLRQVRYLFHHRGKQGVVIPKWGLRQGCKASPCLWAAYTALLCVNISSTIGGDWVKDHLTKYADDSHLRWRFQSFEQFEAIMQEVCQVFACFRKFHMKINLEKSKAILKMVGTLKHKVRKAFIRKTNVGHRLLLSPRNPDKWLALVPSTEYLGTIVSYQQFELQTMRHRISKANGRRWALASFLHSRRISVKLKLRIWQSSVLSSLLYGLSTCGLTGDQVEGIQRVIMKHVRAIISNQAHLTGDKHETIIRRYHIPLAVDLLQAELHRAGTAQEQHADWMYEAEWQMRMHGIIDDQVTFDKTLHSVRGARKRLFMEEIHLQMVITQELNAAILLLLLSAEPVPQGFDELEDFFGEVKAEGQATNKRRKPEHPDRPFRPSGPSGRADPLILSLARAVVRQEEELKVLKQDPSIVMWLRPGEYGILHHLYVTARAFKQKQQENPMWAPGQQPLRTVMAIALFREMEARVNKVLGDESLQKKAAYMGWRDPATGWRYQRWNPTLKHLEVDSSRNPLTDQQVLQAFQLLYKSLDQDSVTRFSCTRKVTETMTNQATFLMDISVRTPAAMETWKTMHMAHASGMFGSATRRNGVSERHAQMQPSRGEDQGDAAWPSRLRLQNPGNHCYFNSFVQVLCWLLHRDPDRLASLGRCAQFINSLRHSSTEKSHNLMSNFLWRILLRGWTDVQRQHDVVEFAAHFVNKHELVLFQVNGKHGKAWMGYPGNYPVPLKWGSQLSLFSYTCRSFLLVWMLLSVYKGSWITGCIMTGFQLLRWHPQCFYYR
ncbi:unnamed protein product, partial [Symbiodinium sp. CCMP2592]